MMFSRMNRWLETLSNFFAHRKGLLPMVGIILVLTNFLIQFVPSFGLFSDSNLFLHLGIVITILGFLLAWAL